MYCTHMHILHKCFYTAHICVNCTHHDMWFMPLAFSDVLRYWPGALVALRTCKVGRIFCIVSHILGCERVPVTLTKIH